MKKFILSMLILFVSITAFSQPSDSVSILKKRIDSLQMRLDEKNYTRVPNKDLEDAFHTKVKEEVNGWFTSNFLVGSGILAALVALILTVGRRMITKELDSKLKNYVEDKTNDISKRFDEHRKNIKDDFNELKASIGEKLLETNEDVKKYRNNAGEIFEKFKKETEESFNEYVDKKLVNTESKVSELQSELNETVSLLFNQTVDVVLKSDNSSRNEKAEEMVKYLEMLIKKGRLPSEKSAAEAMDAIIRVYYSRLNTAKIISLINEYAARFDLSAASYANAALAFLDKYESGNNVTDRNSCINYCDESLKKTFDYGIPFAVKLFVLAIDYTRAFGDADKDTAAVEIRKVFHQIKFTQSKYIAKEVLDRIDVSKNSYLRDYVASLEELFENELKELRERATPATA